MSFSTGSFSTAITPAILDTVLALLAPFFLIGADGDLIAARHAANHMLADYQAETQEELRLAAEIISFGFQALQALSEAAAADLPPNKILRLRGNAVSLNRSAQQNQRTLDRLRRERCKAAPTAKEAAIPPAQPQPAATPDQSAAGQAPATMDFAGHAPDVSSNKTVRVWSRAAEQQRMARRMAENHKRKQAEQKAQENLMAMPVRMPVGMSAPGAAQAAAV
ncbi:hypothetical protein [Rhodopila sp.]|uniref:hypothetical protein n=1 Tax=Rhodopila sp. TaxID=2480087 RepID=UPI003D0DE186